MTSLAPYQPQPPAVPDHESWMRVYEPLVDLAGRLANSPFVPQGMRGDIPGVFSVLLCGHGLRLDPIASLRSIDLIQGKPYIKTEMLLGKVFEAGHTVQWGECDERRATVRISRGDGRGSAEVTYTIAMAERAGLSGKDPWRKTPGDMLRARAARTAMKMVCPDIMAGLETAESPAVGLAEAPTGGYTTVQVQPAPTAPEPPQIAATALADVEESPAGTGETAAEDQPTLAPAPVTRQQLRKLNAQLGEMERAAGEKLTRDDRRDLIRGLAGLEVLGSANDLTLEQASRAIDALEELLTAAATPRQEEPADG